MSDLLDNVSHALLSFKKMKGDALRLNNPRFNKKKLSREDNLFLQEMVKVAVPSISGVIFLTGCYILRSLGQQKMNENLLFASGLECIKIVLKKKKIFPPQFTELFLEAMVKVSEEKEDAYVDCITTITPEEGAMINFNGTLMRVV